MSKGKLGAGSLSLTANARSYPRQKISGTMNANKSEITRLALEVLSSDLMSNPKYWSRLALYHISHFYEVPIPDTDQDNMTPKKIARGTLGLLCMLADPENIAANMEMNRALEEAGIDITYYSQGENDVKRLSSHHYNQMKSELKDAGKWEDVTTSMNGPLIMIGVILLTIVKQITPDNAQDWISNRIRTFSGVVGDMSWRDEWSNDLFPSQRYLAMNQSFMSANHNFRRAIFLVLNSISSKERSTLIVKVCREIIQMIRGAEMHHLILIDTYLIRRYPELKALHALRDLQGHFDKVLERLKQEHKEDALFIRLLYDKDLTAELTRKNFKIAAIVATACARFETPSFENFFMDKTESAADIADWVTNYLETRRKLTLFAIADSVEIQMGEHERKQYLDKILSDFVKENQPPSELGGNSPADMRVPPSQIKKVTY